MENNLKMVPAKCTQCGGVVEVDEAKKTAECPFCGMTFVIEDAVKDYNVSFNVNDAVKDVLDFAGEQMKENRQRRQEEKKEFESTQKNFFKVFLIIFAISCAFSLIMFVIMQFVPGAGGDTGETTATETADSTIDCYIKDGCLYTEVRGVNLAVWKYQAFDSMGTTLQYEENSIDRDSYESCVTAEENVDEGVRYVVTAAYEDDFSTESTDPLYYSVVRVVIENSEIVEASEPAIVNSLSEYDFE